MNKDSKNISRFERYMYKEIGIEFKACLYFYVIVLYYAFFRYISGVHEASIIHMAEMILITYVMGYVQVYLLSGVDEDIKLSARTVFNMILCSGIYTAFSVFLGWFESIYLIAGFFAYMLFAYFCAYWIYKMRRDMDEKMLNDDLAAFQARKKD